MNKLNRNSDLIARKKVLNLQTFKLKKCKNKKKHKEILCNFYHHSNDKRRNLYWVSYSFKQCLNNNCNIENCKFSHNNYESHYHPNFYKKKICKKFFAMNKCKYNNFCSFAHSEDELRINLIHKLKFNYIFFLFFFKTECCPWGKIDHNKNLCVYYHNYNDFKRKNLHLLIPKQCKNWNKFNINNEYNKDCKDGFYCKYLHGFNEILFHPFELKLSVCRFKLKFCNLKKICKFISNKKKKINEEIIDKALILKNRIN